MNFRYIMPSDSSFSGRVPTHRAFQLLHQCYVLRRDVAVYVSFEVIPLLFLYCIVIYRDLKTTSMES